MAGLSYNLPMPICACILLCVCVCVCVCVCPCVLVLQRKCEKYWPDAECAMAYGEVSVFHVRVRPAVCVSEGVCVCVCVSEGVHGGV